MTDKEFGFEQKIKKIATIGTKERMKLIYEWVQMDQIDMEEFDILIKFIKG